jgi:hypothetical protein
MARAANLIVALSARNGLCVAGSSPFRKHIAIVDGTNHLRSSKSCKFEQIMAVQTSTHSCRRSSRCLGRSSRRAGSGNSCCAGWTRSNRAAYLRLAETLTAFLARLRSSAETVIAFLCLPALFVIPVSFTAGSFIALYYITLPQIRPGIIAGFLFAFITSFDDLTIALFVSGGKTSTCRGRCGTTEPSAGPSESTARRSQKQPEVPRPAPREPKTTRAIWNPGRGHHLARSRWQPTRRSPHPRQSPLAEP